jgi:xanthine/CO dehydrogenase XdhC/CoxF family maturation factor
MFEHKTFIRFVDESFEKGLDIVCLSIVKTEGSTYQKPGSIMLVNSAHEMVGVLSGGCIEEALLHCCDEVLQKGVGKLVTHDLRLPDDSLQSWEEGVGCNGLIQVWLEPFYRSHNYGILGEAVLYAKEGKRGIFHRSLEGKAPFIETESVHQPMLYDEVHHTLILPIEPCFKVLILGVGSAVQAVVDMANILGWQTYVCDTRADALDVIVNADEKRLFASATECETLLGEERFDACVIMSHLFKADSAYLKSALHSKASYIGLLGSKTRSHKIIESLGESITLDERFHAPIGLGIGAKTPQAIALAICAQIESEKNKRV